MMATMNSISVYIEDHLDSALLMELIFPLHDLDLVVFTDSHDILHRIKSLPSIPRLFLLDIHVPPLNGFEILALLRADAAYQDVPVLALTASVMNEEIQRLRAAGFSGVLPKPVDIATFPEYVGRILSGDTIWGITA
jgi:CheY-like chemotaxis protein